MDFDGNYFHFISLYCIATLPNGIELEFQPIGVLPFVNTLFAESKLQHDQEYLQDMNLQNIAEKILLTLTQETPIPFCGQFSLKSRHLVPISCSKLRLFTSAVSVHIFSVALSNCYAYWMYQLYRYNIYITYIRCIRTLHLLDYCEFS